MENINTSTPIETRITGRKSIKDKDIKNADVSPIISNKSKSFSPRSRSQSPLRGNSTSSSSDSEGSYEENSSSIHEPSYNIKNTDSSSTAKSNNVYYVLGIIIVSLLIALALSPSDEILNDEIPVTINMLKEWFPKQNLETWIALESGVQEVKQFNKPSVFLFLYKSDSEQTLELLLKNITSYAACILNNNCTTSAITVSNNLLNSAKAKNNYGYIIETYRDDLKEKSIMIIKNFDKIPGKVARAFHSFCDEITPLIHKSIFFFTMKVDEFPKQKKEIEFVENVLRMNWSDDVDDDELAPLITRILSIVLKILPENK